MARDHARFEEDIAPYLLGALPPIEAEELETHLRTCSKCRRELERLRPGAEALARSVEAVEPPPSLRDRLVEEVRRDEVRERSESQGAPTANRPERGGAPARTDRSERGAVASPSAEPERRRSRERSGRWGRLGSPALRLAPIAAAAAVVAVAAGVIGSALVASPRPRTVAAIVDRGRLPGVTGRLTVLPDGRTAVLHLTGLRQLGPSRTYELWVARDGRVSPGPLFNPSASGAALTGVSGNVRGVDAVLVTRERAGGAQAPSEQPVVRVPLS